MGGSVGRGGPGFRSWTVYGLFRSLHLRLLSGDRWHTAIASAFTMILLLYEEQSGWVDTPRPSCDILGIHWVLAWLDESHKHRIPHKGELTAVLSLWSSEAL